MSKRMILKTLSFALVFLLAIAAGISVLSGGQQMAAAGGLDRYDSETQFSVESADGDASSGSSAAEGFVARDRRYTLNGQDLVVLEVENLTERSYSVTVTGAYLDEDGGVIRRETKTFDGFSPGWKNDFFFRPDFSFSGFTYTLRAEAYEGQSVASELSISWKLSRGYAMTPEDEERLNQAIKDGSFRDDDSLHTVPAVFVNLLYENRADLDIDLVGEYLLIDSHGEAFVLGRFACEANRLKVGKCKDDPIYWIPPDSKEYAEYTALGYPEALRGELTVYISLTTVAGEFVSHLTDGETDLLTKRNFSIPGWVDSHFSANGKRYTDADGRNDVVVLDVKNHSQTNMTLTIYASYTSKFGTLLKREVKTFEGFAAGWSNSFVFDPGIAFYEFSYTLEFEEYTGRSDASKAAISWEFSTAIGYAPEVLGHLEDYWASGELPPQQTTLCLDLIYQNQTGMDMRLRGEVLIIGTDGKLFYNGRENEYLLPAGQETYTPQTICTLADGETLPEALNGEKVKIIFSVTGAIFLLSPTEV